MREKKIGNELSIRNHIMIRAWSKINPHMNLKWNSTKAIDLLGVINYKCWKSRRDRTQTELGYTTKLLRTRYWYPIVLLIRQQMIYQWNT